MSVSGVDHLDRRIAEGDDPATPELRSELLEAFRQTVRIPETRQSGEPLRILSALWTCVTDTDPSARLSDVAELLQGGLRPTMSTGSLVEEPFEFCRQSTK